MLEVQLQLWSDLSNMAICSPIYAMAVCKAMYTMAVRSAIDTMAVLELAGLHVGHGDASGTASDSFGDRDVAFPPPMLVPDQVHFFNGDALRLGHKEEDERLHDDHPGGEE